jgi:hypothetical protein
LSRCSKSGVNVSRPSINFVSIWRATGPCRRRIVRVQTVRPRLLKVLQTSYGQR